MAGLAAAALLLAASPARAQDPRPLEPALFVATLDRLAWEVRAAGTPEQASTLAGRLPAEWTVQAGADRFTVSAAPLAEALREAAKHDDAVAFHVACDGVASAIEAMRAEAERLTGDGPAPPAHVRTALGEVLAAPEFRGREQYAALMGLAERLREWARSWFRPLAGGDRAVGTFLRWVSWIAAAAAFGVLAVLVWRLLRGASRDTGAVAARLQPAADPADARTWARRARAAAAAGDAREAVRCAYHAVLHRLDEDGAWTIEEARTPREYLRLLPPADRRHPAVAFVARLFEGTWYGGAQPGLDEAQAALGRLGELGCDTHADPAI